MKYFWDIRNALGKVILEILIKCMLIKKRNIMDIFIHILIGDDIKKYVYYATFLLGLIHSLTNSFKMNIGFRDRVLSSNWKYTFTFRFFAKSFNFFSKPGLRD